MNATVPEPESQPPAALDTKPWYAHAWLTIVTLLFFPPVGCLLMWKYQRWGAGAKLAATFCSLAIFVAAQVNSANKASGPVVTGVNTTTSAPTDTSSATEAPTPKGVAKPVNKTTPNTSPTKATQPDRGGKLSSTGPASAPQKASDVPAPSNQSANKLPDNVHMENIPGVGKREVGVVDGVAYAILKIEKAGALGSEFSSAQAGGTFAVVRVVAYNTDKKTHNVTTAIMTLFDDKDREFEQSTDGSSALLSSGDQSAEPFSAQVHPNVVKRFTLVYDVPSDAKGFKLKIPAGFGFGQDAIIGAP